jgi:transposase-like protein
MGNKKRKYTKELKTELVERVLAGASRLEVANEEGINPNLITRWKSQYMRGKFHGTSAQDTELRKMAMKICKLEQMVGRLTMENYLLKKEKEYLAAIRKESLSPVSGPNLNPLRRWQD